MSKYATQIEDDDVAVDDACLPVWVVAGCGLSIKVGAQRVAPRCPKAKCLKWHSAHDVSWLIRRRCRHYAATLCQSVARSPQPHSLRPHPYIDCRQI